MRKKYNKNFSFVWPLFVALLDHKIVTSLQKFTLVFKSVVTSLSWDIKLLSTVFVIKYIVVSWMHNDHFSVGNYFLSKFVFLDFDPEFVKYLRWHRFSREYFGGCVITGIKQPSANVPFLHFIYYGATYLKQIPC